MYIWKYKIVGSRIILSPILLIPNSNHTQKLKYLCENPFFLKEKIIGQTSNQFHYYQPITISLVYVSWLKEKISYFSLLSHTLSLCLTAKDKKKFLCSHTLIIYLEGSNHLLSPPWISSWRRQPFTLSSLDIFLKAATLCSLLLGNLLKGGNTLLSPPWLSSWRQQPFALSSLSIFSKAETLCFLLLALPPKWKYFFFHS